MKPIAVSSLLLTAALATAACAGAQPPPEDGMRLAPVEATHLTTAPAAGMALGGLSIRFEETALETVRQAVGVGVIQHQGDAGDSQTWLCYALPAADGGARLWLRSSELGGGSRITGASVRWGGSTRSEPGCPALPAAFRPLRFDGDTPLARDPARWHGVPGVTAREVDGRLVRDYLAPFGTQGCERSGWLRTRARGGQLDAVDIGQLTTC